MATVKPIEVGGMVFEDSDFGDFLGNELKESVAIISQVGEELLAPGFALLVGSFGSEHGQGVDLG